MLLQKYKTNKTVYTDNLKNALHAISNIFQIVQKILITFHIIQNMDHLEELQEVKQMKCISSSVAFIICQNTLNRNS